MTCEQLDALRGHTLSLAFCDENENVISRHVGASLHSNGDTLHIDPDADILFTYHGPGEFVRVWVCINGVPKAPLPLENATPSYVREGDTINLVIHSSKSQGCRG